MAQFLGLLLVVAGALQLACLDWMVHLKRQLKPWWTSEDRVRDARLREVLKIVSFVASLVYIELGIYLAQWDLIPLVRRLLGYVLVGLLAWRRSLRAAC